MDEQRKERLAAIGYTVHDVEPHDDGRPVVAVSRPDGQPYIIEFPVEPDTQGGDWPAIAEIETVTVCAQGWRLCVWKGNLEIASRAGKRVFPLGEHKLRTLWFLNDGGSFTAEALAWCHEYRVAVFLRIDDTFISVNQPAVFHRPALLRKQALAPALPLAKRILAVKFQACAAVCPGVQAVMRRKTRDLATVANLDDAMLIEAHAALSYWAEQTFALRFASPATWPKRWGMFEGRTSSLSKGQRHATHPVNAMLNYAYTVVAGQVERALISAGLDVALGHLHADREGRASLVYDVIEPLRPLVDRAVLTWVRSCTWRRGDFLVGLRGVVRLTDDVARAVVHAALLPEKIVADVVKAYVSWLRAEGEGQHDLVYQRVQVRDVRLLNVPTKKRQRASLRPLVEKPLTTEPDKFAMLCQERGIAQAPSLMERSPITADKDPLLSVQDIRRLSGVPQGTVYHWFETGQLPSFRTGRRRFIREQDWRDFVARTGVEPSNPAAAPPLAATCDACRPVGIDPPPLAADTGEPYLSVGAIRERTGLSQGGVYELFQSGRLKSEKRGGRRLVRESECQRFMRTRLIVA